MSVMTTELATTRSIMLRVKALLHDKDYLYLRPADDRALQWASMMVADLIEYSTAHEELSVKEVWVMTKSSMRKLRKRADGGRVWQLATSYVSELIRRATSEDKVKTGRRQHRDGRRCPDKGRRLVA